MNDCAILQLDNVSLAVKQTDGTLVNLLSNISFEILKPCILQIIGPSGSGKSKLLRLINRLEEATGGKICIQGNDIKKLPIQKLRRRVQMMQQEPVLIPETVLDNLKLPWSIIDEELPSDFVQQATQALELAKLEADRINQKVEQLSLGQKQRVAFARALLIRPQIMLLDEPTSALDANLAFDLLDTIREVQSKQQITILMVTHRLEEVTYINDQAAVIIEGKLTEFGNSEQIMSQPQNAITSEFLRNFKRNNHK